MKEAAKLAMHFIPKIEPTTSLFLIFLSKWRIARVNRLIWMESILFLGAVFSSKRWKLFCISFSCSNCLIWDYFYLYQVWARILIFLVLDTNCTCEDKEEYLWLLLSISIKYKNFNILGFTYKFYNLYSKCYIFCLWLQVTKWKLANMSRLKCLIIESLLLELRTNFSSKDLQLFIEHCWFNGFYHYVSGVKRMAHTIGIFMSYGYTLKVRWNL